MRERRHRPFVLVAAILVAVTAGLGVGPSAWASPDTTTPSTDAPTETTEPPVDDTTVDDTLVGAGEPDSDVDGTVAAIAIIGFVLLLAVAAWWMVRRSNPDGEPKPPAQPTGLPPSDLI